MREIAFDTETTGLDPNSGHRIVEMGCVEMIDKIRTGKSYQCYINPERDMPYEAERVHGISAEFLQDKPVFSQICEDFLDFIGESPLVIHNAGFDMKFVNYEIGQLGFPALPMSRTVDTVTIARQKFPGSPANLDALCRRFEIDLTARTKHGALLDAELLADVYLELCGGRQAAIHFDALKNIGKDLPSISQEKKQEIAAREFPVSEAELRAHDRFTEQLKDALWKAFPVET